MWTPKKRFLVESILVTLLITTLLLVIFTVIIALDPSLIKPYFEKTLKHIHITRINNFTNDTSPKASALVGLGTFYDFFNVTKEKKT